MAITAKEFVDNMGVGWNLGNTFECAFKTYDHLQFKSYYSLILKVKYGDTISQVSSKSIDANTNNTFSISGKFPNIDSDETISLIIELQNTKLISTSESPVVTISFAELKDSSSNNIDISGLIGDNTFPVMKDSNSLITYETSSTLTSLKNGTISLSGKLSVMPKSSDSNSKKRLADLTPICRGTVELNYVQLDAVKAAGFKTIRMPITWKDHISEDNIIDTEWFEKIGTFAHYIVYDLGLNLIINLHHDDNENWGGWLYSDTFLTDTDMQNKYISVWTQIATYFASYPQDKLAFAGYNETRGSNHSWDTTDSDNLYGIIKIGEAFYNTVRSIIGNEDRILFFPSYAAKTNCINRSFTTNEGTSEIFHIPEDDYCGFEVHIYSTNISSIRSDINTIAKVGKPVIIGEFGINANQMNIDSILQSQEYIVAYARYKGIGAIIWDDYGGMQVLQRNKVTSLNYNSEIIWNGNTLEFVSLLVKSSELKTSDIITETNLYKAITGDKVKLFLDSDYKSIFNIEEGNEYGVISDSVFTAGLTGISKILGISKDGKYGVCEIEVSSPTHFKDISNEVTLSMLESGTYNFYNTNHGLVDNSTGTHVALISVPSASTITLNCSSDIKVQFVEYSSSKSLTKPSSDYYKTYKTNGDTQILASNTCYVGINVEGFTSDSQQLEFTITTRDFDYEEYTVESRETRFANFNNFNIGIYRTIEVIGNIQYTVSFNYDDLLNINIKELNKDNTIINDFYCKNGESFTTKPFTHYIQIELYPQSTISYKDFMKLFNDWSIVPCLLYNNYTFVSDDSLKEDCPELDINSGEASVTKKFYTNNGKLIKYNGKFVK